MEREGAKGKEKESSRRSPDLRADPSAAAKERVQLRDDGTGSESDEATNRVLYYDLVLEPDELGDLLDHPGTHHREVDLSHIHLL